MKKVVIIGVSEHFNFPWHLAMEEQAFTNRGIELQWQDIPEGTGKMVQMLQKNEADMAIVLTEGMVKSIAEGNKSKIIQGYIASPLLWGIHVDANSRFKSIDDIKYTKAAISRLGSGSHLMAYVHAKQLGWETKNLNFEIVNNLDGAVNALVSGSADYFMWEHFTTKPLVDQGVFRWLGDCPTPWPCFVIAVSDRFLAENREILSHVLEVINLYTEEFKSIPSMDRTLANAYGQGLQDVKKWLSMTHWSQDQLNPEVVHNIQNTLFNLKLIPHKIHSDQILGKL